MKSILNCCSIVMLLLSLSFATNAQERKASSQQTTATMHAHTEAKKAVRAEMTQPPQQAGTSPAQSGPQTTLQSSTISRPSSSQLPSRQPMKVVSKQQQQSQTFTAPASSQLPSQQPMKRVVRPQIL